MSAVTRRYAYITFGFYVCARDDAEGCKGPSNRRLLPCPAFVEAQGFGPRSSMRSDVRLLRIDERIELDVNRTPIHRLKGRSYGCQVTKSNKEGEVGAAPQKREATERQPLEAQS